VSNSFNDELAGAGHNSGATPAELVGDEIDSALAQYVDRSTALVKSATDRVVTDNDSIGRAADTQAMIRALQDTIWARAKDVAAPHTTATNVVKSRTERFLADLAQADEMLTGKIRDCRTAQRARAAAAREEQRQMEAEMRGPEVVNPQVDSTPIALPKVRGDYGSTVSDRALTTYVYADARKLPKALFEMPVVADAIQKALKVYMKAHPKTKGVTASTDMTTTHRRPI
jgi:hypothetical protein